MSQRHAGRAGTGVDLEIAGAGIGDVLDVDQAYTRVEWLEIDGNNFANNTAVITNTNAVAARLSNLVVHDVGSVGTNGYAIFTQASGGLEQIRNCVIYEIGLDGVHVASNNVRIQNVSFYLTQNGGEGIQIDNAPTGVVAENVIAAGGAPDFFENTAGALTCTNCISSDNTADDFGGTGNLVGRAAASQFVSLTAPVDLHLRYGSAAVDAGKDLSATFTDDIDGQTRPLGAAWDVGADEAGAQMLVKSGTYVGNGTTQSIAGVGFQPDLVIITSDSTNAAVGTTFPSGHTAVLRTSTMSGNVSKAGYVYNFHPLANRDHDTGPERVQRGAPGRSQRSERRAQRPLPLREPQQRPLLLDGLQGGAGRDGGRAATRATAPPPRTSRRSASSRTTRSSCPTTATDPSFASRPCPADYSFDFDGGSQCPAGCSRSPESGIRTELANGFRVGHVRQRNGATSTTTSPGSRRRAGSRSARTPATATTTARSPASGFRPEFVTVSNGVTPIPNTSTVFKTASTGTSSDYSLVYVAYDTGDQGPDDIQAIQADGFQVGTNGNVNAFNEPLLLRRLRARPAHRGGDQLPLDRHRGGTYATGTGHGHQRLGDGDRNRDAVGHRQPRPRGLHHDHRPGQPTRSWESPRRTRWP